MSDVQCRSDLWQSRLARIQMQNWYILVWTPMFQLQAGLWKFILVLISTYKYCDNRVHILSKCEDSRSPSITTTLHFNQAQSALHLLQVPTPCLCSSWRAVSFLRLSAVSSTVNHIGKACHCRLPKPRAYYVNFAAMPAINSSCCCVYTVTVTVNWDAWTFFFAVLVWDWRSQDGSIMVPEVIRDRLVVQLLQASAILWEQVAVKKSGCVHTNSHPKELHGDIVIILNLNVLWVLGETTMVSCRPQTTNN